MKLFYTQGACSLSPHIVLREAGIPFELVNVDLKTHTTKDGQNYYEINEKGYVPALQLDNGDVLTEGVAIVQYVADLAKNSGLIAENGTIDRYRTQEWLTFISSEVHKTFSGLFNPALSEEAKKNTIERLHKRFPFIEKALAKNAFITGNAFTVVDAYAYTILRWSGMFAIDLSIYPNITRFMKEVGERPKVQEALKAEGLL
jgi:glutathione S-transferase